MYNLHNTNDCINLAKTVNSNQIMELTRLRGLYLSSAEKWANEGALGVASIMATKAQLCREVIQFSNHLYTTEYIDDAVRLTKTLKCLKEAVKWWEEDVQYMTTGDYGEYNVFDDDPEWVFEARKILSIGGGN